MTLSIFAISEEINIICFIFLIILLYLNLRKINHKTHLPEILLGLIIGYSFGGFMSGLVHWFMNSYDYETLQERHFYFRDHHITPTNMIQRRNYVLLTEIAPPYIPLMLLLLLTNNTLIIISVCVGAIVDNLSQIIHKLAHMRNHQEDRNENGEYKYPRVPYIAKKLQDSKLILHPYEHSLHHETELKNYCIAHSNSDKLFEYVIIELLGLKSSLYMHTHEVVTPLKYEDRKKRIGNVTLYNVFNEQIYLIVAVMIYITLKSFPNS